MEAETTTSHARMNPLHAGLILTAVAAVAAGLFFGANVLKNREEGKVVRAEIEKVSVMPGYVHDKGSDTLLVTSSNPLPGSQGEIYRRTVKVDENTVIEAQDAPKSAEQYAEEVAAFEARVRALEENGSPAAMEEMDSLYAPTPYGIRKAQFSDINLNAYIVVFSDSNILSDETFIATRVLIIPMP